jgi:hypothetical protein
LFEVVFVDGALHFYRAMGFLHVGVHGAFSGGFEFEKGGLETVEIGAQGFFVAQDAEVKAGFGIVPDSDSDADAVMGKQVTQVGLLILLASIDRLWGSLSLYTRA